MIFIYFFQNPQRACSTLCCDLTGRAQRAAENGIEIPRKRTPCQETVEHRSSRPGNQCKRGMDYGNIVMRMIDTLSLTIDRMVCRTQTVPHC